MGRLTFGPPSFEALAPDTMLVTGTWRLLRDGDAPHGRYALVMRRLPEGWRIVLDDTTSLAD